MFSVWNSFNIVKYFNLSLKFYEVSNVEDDLCKIVFMYVGNF